MQKLTFLLSHLFFLCIWLDFMYQPHCLRAYKHSWETFKTSKYFRYLMLRKCMRTMFNIIGLCGILIIKALCLLCKRRRPPYFSNSTSINTSRRFQWICNRKIVFFSNKDAETPQCSASYQVGPFPQLTILHERQKSHVSVTSLWFSW